VGSWKDLSQGFDPVITKPIQWFEAPQGVPAALHTTEVPVVCLNYKDYDDRKAGVEPWFLCNPALAIVPLLNEWEDDMWAQLKRGAQEMVDYAIPTPDTGPDFGFIDGNFYGIFWVQRGVESRDIVSIGLVYVNLTNVLTPCQGMKAVVALDDSKHVWVTPQCAIPLFVDVNLPSDQPIRRVSRYKRKWVI
jgi:hypothetical protein